MHRGWGVVLILLTSGCQDFCEQQVLSTCDIRNVDCQETVIEALQCLRLTRLTERPPVRVVQPEDYAELLRKYFTTTPRTPLFESALRQLGVLPADVGLVDAGLEQSANFAGAYFVAEEHSVYVIDRGQPLDDRNAVGLLLHELTHAIQHEESDVTALQEAAETTEASVRVRMAIEGEATFYGLLADAWTEGFAGAELDWQRYFADSVAATAEEVRQSRVPYLAAQLLFPYVIGSRYNAALSLRGGDVPAVLADPPSSTEFMRDPFVDRGTAAVRLETSPCEPPPAPAGFDDSVHDERGPLFLYAFLLPLVRDHDLAWTMASSWQRDDLHIHGAPDGRVALVWRIHVAGVRIAEEIASYAATGSRVVRAKDSVVTLQSVSSGDGTAWHWDAPLDGCAFPAP